MRIEEAFDVAASAPEVFEGLNDVGEIGYCVAGVTDVTVLNHDESQWRVEQRFGTIARTFNLDARIVDRQQDERITFIAKTQEVEVNGHVALVAMTPALTRCEVEIEVDIIGPLASFAATFARGPQKRLIEQTLSNLRERLEQSGGDRLVDSARVIGPVTTIPGSSARRKSLMRHMVTWLRNRFRI